MKSTEIKVLPTQGSDAAS